MLNNREVVCHKEVGETEFFLQVIEEIDDVFFLTPDEYDEPAGQLRGAVAARRAERRRWMAVNPPLAIGNIEPALDAAFVPTFDGVVRGAR